MNRQSNLEHLHQRSPLIVPSMLKCDFGNLHREVELLESAGVDAFHWDVMDGHFVPNLSYGAMVIERVRPMTDRLFDAHLMIDQPERYLEAYLRAGCEAITFHVEAVDQPAVLLREIRRHDVIAGLALNPGTPVSRIEAALPECDLVLVMSVEPGFGGQSFMPSVLDKVREIRGVVGTETLISIDGGIGPSTIADAAAAGCDLFAVGSAIFDEPDYTAAVDEMAGLIAARA